MSKKSALYTISDSNFHMLGERIIEHMEHFQVPGVAVGLIHEGREYIDGFGITNIEHPLAVDVDTLFQIGSITKTVTATAIMRLVEQGKLDLDTPIHVYLPELRLSDPEVTERVTVRHLLTHTGGWEGDYFEDCGRGEDALEKIVAKMAGLPQRTPLGKIWSYNNSGFYLAGRVMEVLMGKSYELIVKELVLDPLDMRMSFFFPEDVITYRVAVGHEAREGEGAPVVARPWAVPRSAYPAGGLISSVKDLLHYARFHIGDGTTPDGLRLLTPESLSLMQSFQMTAGSIADAVGLAWLLREIDDTRIVQHEGSTKGQRSILMIVPERSFAIAVLTNADRGASLCREVTRWVLQHYVGLKEPKLRTLELSRDELALYVGKYSTALFDAELILRDSDLILKLQYKAGFPDKDSPPPLRLHQ